MGADSDIGVYLSLVGVQQPDASEEATEVVVSIDPRRRDDRSRQARCVPTVHHDESHRRTGRDTGKDNRGSMWPPASLRQCLVRTRR
jgi:hypothetical protein